MDKSTGRYYVYIIQCKDGTLYTGYTNDLAHRLKMHNSGQGAKYTRGRGPVKLLYQKAFKSSSQALKTEWKIKRLSRKDKLALLDQAWKGSAVQKGHREKTDKNLTRDWFNRWSNEYDQSLGRIGFHRGLLDLVVRQARVRDGDRVLDIGCGTGLLSLKILRAADCSVTGVDISEEMMSLFKDKIGKLGLSARVSLQQMDAAALKFADNSFDLVVSSVTLHHLKDKIPAFRNIHRILKPGGRFVIGEIDMDTSGKHTDSNRLKRILKALEQEWIPALSDAGIETFVKMFDNGKKHILNQGEYCASLEQWAGYCHTAGFGKTIIKKVPGYKIFGIVVARANKK